MPHILKVTSINLLLCTRILKVVSFFFLIFIYFILFLFFLAVLGLRRCTQAFSSCGEQGLLLVAVRGPLIAVSSPAAEHRL